MSETQQLKSALVKEISRIKTAFDMVGERITAGRQEAFAIPETAPAALRELADRIEKRQTVNR